MNRPTVPPITIPPARSLINRSALRRVCLFIPVVLAGFALSQTVKAQDGDEGNSNTAEGLDALGTYIGTASSASFDTAIGHFALVDDTTGNNNTAIGAGALSFNTTGSDNTATGLGALNRNTTGNDNTATGFAALNANTTSSNNTASGFEALFNNTGQANTATGAFALQSNTVGPDNTATGSQALLSNTNGASNTATGAGALLRNTLGNQNTANGVTALLDNTTGNNNTATGVDALLSNTTGGGNTATGLNALGGNTTGNNNTANGLDALSNNTTGKSNIAVGSNAGSKLTTGNNNIDVGSGGVAGESNHIRIGTVGTQTATFIAGIHGLAVTGSTVTVNSNGQLGVAPSSKRFKEAIKPMDKTSEAILALKPVTFHYKKELDPDGIPQFGLVAEEVERVNPDLVARDAEGKPYTVRYEAVNAMLLNEFLKAHKRVEEQERKEQEQLATTIKLESTVAKQNEMIAQQQKQIEALTATVQKVSDQIALSKPAPQLVANP